MGNDSFPRHLLIEIVDSQLLNDSVVMESFLKGLARLYHGEILGLKLHQFEPFGLSALMIMPESHVAVHTWPEYGYASLDIFLRGGDDPRHGIPLIESIFQPGEIKIIELERGVKKGDGTVVHPGLHRKLPDEPQGQGDPL